MKHTSVFDMSGHLVMAFGCDELIKQLKRLEEGEFMQPLKGKLINHISHDPKKCILIFADGETRSSKRKIRLTMRLNRRIKRKRCFNEKD